MALHSCDKQTEVEHRRASRGSPILCYLRTELHLSGLPSHGAYARPYRSNAERLHQLPRWLYRLQCSPTARRHRRGCPRLAPVNNVRGIYS